MNIYAYTQDYMVQNVEHWTGHIDSYFNKRFVYKALNQLKIRVDDKIAEIIELNNSIDFNAVNFKIGSDFNHREFAKFEDLMSRTYNTVYEFIDEDGIRRCIVIGKKQFKKYERNDKKIHKKLRLEVDRHNFKTNEEMYSFLKSLNAIEDYDDYHGSRNEMFKSISEKLEKIA